MRGANLTVGFTEVEVMLLINEPEEHRNGKYPVSVLNW